MRLYNAVIPEFKSEKDKKNEEIDMDDESNQNKLKQLIKQANSHGRN